MTRHSAWRARTVRLLNEPALDADEQARRNDGARARFHRVLGGQPERIFVSCAEHSGEGHARALVAALREQRLDLAIDGFGGGALESEGVALLANLVDKAVIGFAAVLKQLPFYLDVVARYLDYLKRERPDAVVLLDSPGLHMVLAEETKRLGIPVLYYICPQYWAWAPWRLKRFPRAVDGAISILPFERPMFESLGVPTAFAGNPLVTRVPNLVAEPREPILALLPGSRRVELQRNLRPMLEHYRRFKTTHPETRAILPQQNPRQMQRIRKVVAEAERNGEPFEDLELHEGGVFPVLARARAAIVKSGTSTLQTALCRCPQVVFFKMGGFGEKLLSRAITTPWIGAPNIIMGREAVPEFLFHGDGAWPEVYATLEGLWEGERRAEQLAVLDEIHARLSGPGATAEAVRWLLPDVASDAKEPT